MVTMILTQRAVAPRNGVTEWIMLAGLAGLMDTLKIGAIFITGGRISQ